MPTPFLSAIWSNLILASYRVPPDTLAPFLPPGVVPDVYDGSAWASLVAFDFSDARVLGWSVPPAFGLCDFPEFNLRVYARQNGRRGVVFVGEFVPGRVVTAVARAVYNEPYVVAQNFSSRVSVESDLRRVRHDFSVGGQRQTLAVTAENSPFLPAADTFETWVKEQNWGFGRTRGGRTTAYRVAHPPWRVFPVEDVTLAVDFAHLYGPRWAFLQSRTPDSVVLAEGSHISVFPKD